MFEINVNNFFRECRSIEKQNETKLVIFTDYRVYKNLKAGKTFQFRDLILFDASRLQFYTHDKDNFNDIYCITTTSNSSVITLKDVKLYEKLNYESEETNISDRTYKDHMIMCESECSKEKEISLESNHHSNYMVSSETDYKNKKEHEKIIVDDEKFEEICKKKDNKIGTKKDNKISVKKDQKPFKIKIQKYKKITKPMKKDTKGIFEGLKFTWGLLDFPLFMDFLQGSFTNGT